MSMKETLQRALDALGPTPPNCCGCESEWQIAIDAIKEAMREQAMTEVQRLGQEIEGEDFNEVEKLSNLGKQILKQIT